MLQEKLYDEGYYEEEILRPLTYILQVRNSEIITLQIPTAFNFWLKISDDKVHAIQDIMTTFVNSTLLFDDVQDKSIVRRTIPAAHCVFGVPLTINASIHALGIAIEKVLELGHPMAVNVFMKQKLEILRGQGVDIYWRENMVCPTQTEYVQQCEKKSAAMFILPVYLMQLFSDNKTDFTKLLNLIGIYYEIRDDYCNLMKQEGTEGRSRSKELQIMNEVSFCEDMTDGKFTLPVIHALKNKKGKPISYILKQRSRDVTTKRHFMSLLEELGSLQYTRSVLYAYDRDVRAEMARFGGNPLLQEIIEDFFDWTDK